MRPAAAVLAAAVVIVGLSHLLQRRSPDAPSPGLADAPVRVLGAPAPTPAERQQQGVEDEPPPKVHPAPPAATQATRRFLAAYLRWETGASGKDVELTLRRLATNQLWQLLSSSRGQPEPGASVSRAELRSLIAGVTSDSSAATVSAMLTRGAGPSQLAVVVRKVGDRWRVSSLGR